MDKHTFLRQGGKWIEVVRNWIIWNCRNGDRVIWGSNDIIAPDITVRGLEELGGEIAYAVYKDLPDENEAVTIIYNELYRQRSIGKPKGGLIDGLAVKQTMKDAENIAECLGYKITRKEIDK